MNLIFSLLLSLSAPSHFLDYESLSKNIFAVHATDVLPKEGVVKAGFRSPPGDREQGMYHPQVRATLHFALGELVRPVGEDWMSWEDCRYAVIAPLETLLPQTINLNCYDTYILGSLALDEKTTLVLPETDLVLIEERSGFSIWTYDPLSTKLREAVDECIAKLGGYPLRMESIDSENLLGNAFLGDKNVNTPEFFAPLKDRHPQVGVGLRFEPLDGEGYLFSALENKAIESVFYLFNYFLPKDAEEEFKSCFYGAMNLGNLEAAREKITATLELIDRYLEKHTFPEKALADFAKNKEAALQWNTILGIEIAARKNFSKTLHGAPLATKLQLFDVTSGAPIEPFLDSIKESLLEADPAWD